MVELTKLPSAQIAENSGFACIINVLTNRVNTLENLIIALHSRLECVSSKIDIRKEPGIDESSEALPILLKLVNIESNRIDGLIDYLHLVSDSLQI